MLGLIASQLLPGLFGANYTSFREVVSSLLYICLSFIMINVGREFELDKSKWRSYAGDYFIAMATAAMPWLLIALYYVLVLLPSDLWSSGDAWKENLLLSRFAAPTSAGILFTMLAALHLNKTWMYRKIQVLAIFDDLDTILLMIPLQILMIGMRWQLFAIIVVVFVLLWLGWKKLDTYNMPQGWYYILFYAVVIYGLTHGIYVATEELFGADGGIHIEVLLPAFVWGMILKTKHSESKHEHRAADAISIIFMFLVGLSMPMFVGGLETSATVAERSITASQPMMSWGEIALHVLAVSFLSNLGKLFPMFFYRDRKLTERFALSR